MTTYHAFKKASPREAWRRAGVITRHLIVNGALFGVGTRLDPDVKVNRAVYFAMAIFPAVFYLMPWELRLAMLLVAASPAWLYSFSTLLDDMLEYRSYASLLGIAIACAWAGDRAPAAVGFLLICYAARTAERIPYWHTPLEFWTQAYAECPGKMRARINKAERIHNRAMHIKRYDVAESNRLYAEAQSEYEAIFKMDVPQARIAGVNLASLHLVNGRQEIAADILNEAADRWPKDSIVANNRGSMLLGLQHFDDALEEFNLSLDLRPDNPLVLRNRARCYMFLGREKEMEADYERAFQLDGKRGRWNFAV